MGFIPGWLGAVSLLLNGEFATSLDHWTAEGAVFNTGGTAVLSDSVVTPMAIFQSSARVDGLIAYELSFDYLNGLSSVVSPGFVRDTAYLTLFFGKAPFGESLADGAFDVALGLYDLDGLGPFNSAEGSGFGSSSKGPGWSRYTLLRSVPSEFSDSGFVTLSFQFFDLNGISSDSVVSIDNVVLTPVFVPEPGTSLLLIVGMAAGLMTRIRGR